uniref:Uncharacterized protein n=1 Tax=Fusarium oxysporum (strain Fo5176) TaxID=660025 RepID=A0A0D2XQL4_FUSOF
MNLSKPIRSRPRSLLFHSLQCLDRHLRNRTKLHHDHSLHSLRRLLQHKTHQHRRRSLQLQPQYNSIFNTDPRFNYRSRRSNPSLNLNPKINHHFSSSHLKFNNPSLKHSSRFNNKLHLLLKHSPHRFSGH